jgi:hypothetical protein
VGKGDEHHMRSSGIRRYKKKGMCGGRRRSNAQCMHYLVVSLIVDDFSDGLDEFWMKDGEWKGWKAREHIV